MGARLVPRRYPDPAESWRWYTRHARDQLILRYGIDPLDASRVLCDAHKQITEDRSLYLYTWSTCDVHAVEVQGGVGFVAASIGSGVLVTFYPRGARSNHEIRNDKKLRARLEAFEAQIAERNQEMATAAYNMDFDPQELVKIPGPEVLERGDVVYRIIHHAGSLTKYHPFKVSDAMSRGARGVLLTLGDKETTIPYGELRMLPKAPKKKRESVPAIVKAPPPDAIVASLPDGFASWLAQGRDLVHKLEMDVAALKYERAEVERTAVDEETFDRQEEILKQQLVELAEARATARRERADRVAEVELQLEDKEEQLSRSRALMKTLGLD